ncbi:hypothetical protein B9Z55_017181 [Caenorhabditis nigoni]|uniref:Protein kinase domain-containing protein n=1 Tax=Caenorhabditis nigoni TaxID=1611254 RepID=A0A2G5T8B2_9PELO|nr:hypothetical protein B9Z55_017181 [Caenorhabditis nigoni]
MKYVEIQTLPGSSPRPRRKKRRRCPYRKKDKGKIRWRHKLRKWKRRKKRLRKRAKNPKSRSSKSSTMTPEQKERKARRKKIKKRKKLRRKKVQRRKHRIRRHLYGSKHRKLSVKSKKLTKAAIHARLRHLRFKLRVRILHKYQRDRALICSAKRKAIQNLKMCWKRARHRRKKYQRYRRQLENFAHRKRVTQWRNCQIPKEKKAVQVHFDLPKASTQRRKETKRVEYERQHPIKVAINAVEMKSEQVHVAKNGKVVLGSLVVCVKEPIVGDFGQVRGRIQYIGHGDQGLCEVRWQSQLHDKGNGSNEAQILAKLAHLGSQNAVRVLFFGQFLTLQCTMISQLRESLQYCLDHEKLDMQSCVHIIQQSFYCVKDLHKIGYAHLGICPGSFCFLNSNPSVIVFNNFQFSRTFESLRKKPEDSEDLRKHSRKTSRARRLPKNLVLPYMSRRQHFRLVKGAPDDYESWFYFCARVLNDGKPLEWEKKEVLNEMDHMKMSLAKYEFVKKYKHSDPLADKKMKQILAYCLSANETNAKKVGYFVERVIQHWVDKLDKRNAPWPWISEKELGKLEKEKDAWEKKLKEKFPEKSRKCNY